MIIHYCVWWAKRDCRYESVSHSKALCKLVWPFAQRCHQSGKTNKRIRGNKCNKAGQIFKECAQGLLNSKYNAIGGFMKKLKSHKDAGIVIKAGARKIAIAYYNSITKGTEYVEQGIEKYKERLQQKEIALVHKLAKKHNLQITSHQEAA